MLCFSLFFHGLFALYFGVTGGLRLQTNPDTNRKRHKPARAKRKIKIKTINKETNARKTQKQVFLFPSKVIAKV